MQSNASSHNNKKRGVKIKQLVIHGPDKFELIDESETGNYKLVKAKAKDGDRYVIVDAQNNFVGTFRGGRYIPKGEPVGDFYYSTLDTAKRIFEAFYRHQ